MKNSARGANETNNLTHIQNSAKNTNVPHNHREHFQSGAQNTNVSKNLTKHTENSAKGTKVPKNKTEHIQNTAQGTNFTNSHQNKYKTVCETLTQQTVKKTHTKQCARN